MGRSDQRPSFGEEIQKMTLAKRLVLALAVVVVVACERAAPSPTPVPAVASLPSVPEGKPTSLLDLDWDDRAPFRGGLIASEQGVLQQLPGATVYHIDLKIADDLLRLDGQQELRYTNQEMAPLTEVYFRLFPNLFGAVMSVEDVTVDGEEVSPQHELADSAMRVPLSVPLQPGDDLIIGLAFSVDVPLSAEGNYGIFGYMDDVLALAHFYPMVSVYDDEGWNVEIPPQYGDVVFADSSFYIVRVTVPLHLTIVASGVEVQREQTAGGQRVTYAGGPMRDFYLVTSKSYELVSQQVGEVSVNSYAPPELMEGAQDALRYTVDALQVFDRRFGAYPFTELDIVATPTLALGVEYPAIVAIAQRLYPPQAEYAPVYLESTMAHEVGHQWFYSVVGNDQLDEPWLDEALAQYATLVYLQDLYGQQGREGFLESLYSRWDRVDRADIPIGMPVRNYTSQEYGAVVYGRGPLFLEALADEMGEERFASFLRNYYETFKWSIATPEGFKELAESQCGCDLTALFEEWVYAR
jgi:hypothetical protein